MKRYCPNLSSGSQPSHSYFQRELVDVSTDSSFEIVSNQTAAKIYGGIASPQPSTPPQQPPQPAPREKSPTKGLSSPWSAALQNVLDRPPASFPHTLMLGGIAFCGLFAAWTWFGSIQEVSHAQGKLVPQGEVYKVQPVTQGEIAKIIVKEGQHIKKGDVIAELDSRLAATEVDRLQQSLSAYRLQLLQTQGIIEQTQLGLKTQRAIAAAEAREQEVAIAQAKAKAQTSQNVLGQLQLETGAYKARLERLQPLLEEGAIAKDRIFEVEQTLREQNRSVTQQQGDLKQSLTEADRLQAGLAQRQAEGQQSELEAIQRIQQLQIEASTLKAKIAETETLLKTARTQLEQLYLYAPVNGVISSLKIKNKGEVTQPAQTVAEIMPDHVPLVLSAVLPNREAGTVQTGMKVQIKFDAFPYQEYGVVPGKVISISPDAEVDERIGAVYQVKIALDRKAVTHEGRTIELKAGQTAQAEIVTRRRRIIDILLDPIQKLREGGINL
jgi:HlyD family type I secretion membrane fusion protein